MISYTNETSHSHHQQHGTSSRHGTLISKPPPPPPLPNQIPQSIEVMKPSQNPSFADQKDRSLTVMIPRAKYHPIPQNTPFGNQTEYEKGTASICSTTEAKLLSYLDINTNELSLKKKTSNNVVNSRLNSMLYNSIPTGALVSAGFEVSATVGVDNNELEKKILIHNINSNEQTENIDDQQLIVIRKSHR